MSELAIFGFLANALGGRRGGDDDCGHSFPRSDAEDLSRGARFIPSEVTLARRDGTHINFVTECDPNCWYWEMPDGSRIDHFDRMTYNMNGPGPCQKCGNAHTSGGTVKPQ